MVSLLLALLAGALTTLSPCVLPVLPFVVLGALEQHRLGPIALAGGLVAVFATAGTLISGSISALGDAGDALRVVAAALMVLIGVLLIAPQLQLRFAAAGVPAGGLFNRGLERFRPSGLAGQFALGALLGAVWTPCSGPTLGAAVLLAADSRTLPGAALVMLFFGIGACLPLLAIAYGSRRALKSRKETLAKLARVAQPVLGAVMALVGLAILAGLDKMIEAALVRSMPDWLTVLTTRF